MDSFGKSASDSQSRTLDPAGPFHGLPRFYLEMSHHSTTIDQRREFFIDIYDRANGALPVTSMFYDLNYAEMIVKALNQVYGDSRRMIP